jgi:biopolymer transport protein TolR
MAFINNGRTRQAMSEINVTPLVDVMLVLLIIFMVTAPMLQEGVSVELPRAKGGPLPRKQTKENIVISVSKEGAVYINDKPVPITELPAKIVAATKQAPSREVFLRADTKVPYGTVVQIMAELRAAGIASLGMITTPKEEPAPAR